MVGNSTGAKNLARDANLLLPPEMNLKSRCEEGGKSSGLALGPVGEQRVLKASFEPL
jgi:hypothetical protein